MTPLSRCLICAQPSDLPECVSCAVAEETLWKRVLDA